MSRKLSSILLFVTVAVVSLVLFSTSAFADPVTIDPNKPNCFEASHDNGFNPIECTAALAFFLPPSDQPMQNGHCYTDESNASAVSISVHEVDCTNIIKQTTPPAPTSTTTPSNASSRSSAVNCDGTTDQQLQDCLKNNSIIARANEIINFLGAGVGVTVVIMIMIGGIQYITAGSNPQTVAAAKKKITNAIIALVAFLLLFSFMQWLVPGGIF